MARGRGFALFVVLAALVGPMCGGGGGGVSIDVSARNVLGSYTAVVTNHEDVAVEVACTVQAVKDGVQVGEDSFSVSLAPGDVTVHEAKMPLSDFTDTYEGSCS
jgi:hypothetical protein